MKKVLTWLLNHLKLVLGIIVFITTFAIIGTVMLNSYKAYKAYEEKFYQNDLDMRSIAPAEPNNIDIDDEFVVYDSDGSIKSTKSSYKNQFTAWAEDFEVTSTQEEKLVEGSSVLDSYIPCLEKGGTIEFKFSISEKSFVDLDFVIATDYEEETDDGTIYGVKDLLSNVSFIVNGETMEEEIDLLNDGTPTWHHLVMLGFALPEGNVTIQIQNQSGKGKFMPQLRNLSIFSSVVTSDYIKEENE